MKKILIILSYGLISIISIYFSLYFIFKYNSYNFFLISIIVGLLIFQSFSKPNFGYRYYYSFSNLIHRYIFRTFKLSRISNTDFYVTSKEGVFYYSNKVLSRLRGEPAVQWADGSKEWWVGGSRHRSDGPAIEYSNGNKQWWVGDRKHREDGPAVEYSDGVKEWWVNGEKVSENSHNRITSRNIFNHLSEIDLEYLLNDVSDEIGSYKIIKNNNLKYYYVIYQNIPTSNYNFLIHLVSLSNRLNEQDIKLDIHLSNTITDEFSNLLSLENISLGESYNSNLILKIT